MSNLEQNNDVSCLNMMKEANRLIGFSHLSLIESLNDLTIDEILNYLIISQGHISDDLRKVIWSDLLLIDKSKHDEMLGRIFRARYFDEFSGWTELSRIEELQFFNNLIINRLRRELNNKTGE